MTSNPSPIPSGDSKKNKKSGLAKKFGKLSGLSKKKGESRADEETEQPPPPTVSDVSDSESSRSARSDRNGGRRRSTSPSPVVHHHQQQEERAVDQASTKSGKSKKNKEGFVRRSMRSLSRSRSRSASRREGKSEQNSPETIVTVTSCRSDGYYNQKAPGSTSKLPRKAPTNLKLFHELAVGVKDAYAAVGKTPQKPPEDGEGGEQMSKEEYYARAVLWEFIGNIDFLLALVDEVAVDTATRGALKDDTTFKGLRDVIKKCNKVLEEMLVRRERRHTLFFRLVEPGNKKDIERIKAWNEKVEKAVGAVTEGQGDGDRSDAGTESDTDASSISESSTSSKGSVFSRGRQLLPVAGRVRARRATPTPTLRKRATGGASDTDSTGTAAEDGFAASTSAVTQGNLAALQESLGASKQKGQMPTGLVAAPSIDKPKDKLVGAQQQIQPKDELVDVIRGLRLEKMKNREGTPESDLVALKPDWRPKAEIPSAVPKLPIEYIHRHRLMKQVVSSLLDQNGDSNESPDIPLITSITSRHGDKAGNGKTIVAVAAIQTVEVRERFPDGIAWIHLGRGPLSERDIRRLYEELYRQLIIKDSDIEDISDDEMSAAESPTGQTAFENKAEVANGGISKNGVSSTQRQRLIALADHRRRFQSGEIEGVKEEIGRLLAKKRILICLDDVCRVEDAKWFIFDNQILNGLKPAKKVKNPSEVYPGRILITTRTPSLLGPGLVQEVFVRILSEHEAVKLLLSTSGRRPYGGKNSAVFNQAKLIVKGCGNSPLAVRIAGSMLRHSSRSWNISSPAWSSLIHQCRLNLEEASQLRSFVNAVNRVVDLSFFTVSDVRTRVALRKCFVAFAIAFKESDWVLSGKGIPQSVVLRIFRNIISADIKSTSVPPAGQILSMLEKLNLLERARHGLSARTPLAMGMVRGDSSDGLDDESDWDETDEPKINSGSQQMFVMHESLKAVAEEMAARTTSTLSPSADSFTSYVGKIDEEQKFGKEMASQWGTSSRFLAQQSAAPAKGSKHGFHDDEAHKLVVSSLLNTEGSEKARSIVEALRSGHLEIIRGAGGHRMEEYLATFLPSHLMHCNCIPAAAEVLADTHFISRRVHVLGIVEATARHVADLQELRRIGGNVLVPGDKDGSKFDVNSVMRDGSRVIIEEVYRVANKLESSPDSLGMAMCLAAVGEGLLKARQPRDAMLRLEEAVTIFRDLLGSAHTHVADALHAVAKALVKLGETRVALLKFAESARIYESCQATLHYNSIANAQSLASLLVDLGDMDKAQSMFEEVISMRKNVYGEHCVSVAKTINAYAILLAKHGKMNLALQNYEAAKLTYDSVPAQLIKDPEHDVKCKYDVTLINLNIASIRSKKGDLKAAISCYEEGVRGLREYETAQNELHKDGKAADAGKNTAHKHLVAALGRIGSLKLKIGDNVGALEAYMTLLREVQDDSPAASQTEKAKAHIKCATIFRQQEGPDSHAQSIAHLREALDMYTTIFGPDHKDTSAIAASLRQWLAEDRKD